MEGKLLPRSPIGPGSQPWGPWGLWLMDARSRAEGLQGPCGDVSFWRSPSSWVQRPMVSQLSSAQTSGSAAKPQCCLFCIGSFFRVGIWCLSLILQVEREEKTALVSLPSPLCLHPALDDTTVTAVLQCPYLERCLQPGVSFGQVP